MTGVSQSIILLQGQVYTLRSHHPRIKKLHMGMELIISRPSAHHSECTDHVILMSMQSKLYQSQRQVEKLLMWLKALY